MDKTLKHKNHDFLVDSSSNEKKSWIVMWITLITMIVEISAGFIYGSMALLADGWHMGTHVAAFAITIFAYKYAKKHSKSGKFTYGIGKVNTLAGYTSAVALGVVAMFMIVESVVRFFSPEEIHYTESIVVAVIGLIINAICALLLGHDHSHDHGHSQSHEHSHEHGKECSHHHEHHEDHNLKAAYFHVIADALTSIFAIIALLAARFFGLTFLDPLMGIIGAIVISKWAYGLVKETSPMLLDEECEHVSKEIERLIEKEHSNCKIIELHSWAIAPQKYAVSLTLTECGVTAALVREEISNIKGVEHIVVEID